MLRIPSLCHGDERARCAAAPCSILNGTIFPLAFLMAAWQPAYAATPVSPVAPERAAAIGAIADPHIYCGLPVQGASVDGPSASGAANTLAELVAIGMKQNTETRVAWSQAEEAALNLGIARSKYGPILAAQAAALHDHAAFPLPKTLNPNGYFKSDAEALVPALTLKWLLYDGGGREAVLDRAGQQLAGANFGFSAAHRRVTIQITQQFFRLSAQVARLAAAQDTLHSAQAVEQLAQARQHRGLGTAPETLQARAQVAEAQLQMEAADAAAQDVHMALLEAAGMRRAAGAADARAAKRRAAGRTRHRVAARGRRRRGAGARQRSRRATGAFRIRSQGNAGGARRPEHRPLAFGRRRLVQRQPAGVRHRPGVRPALVRRPDPPQRVALGAVETGDGRGAARRCEKQGGARSGQGLSRPDGGGAAARVERRAAGGGDALLRRHAGQLPAGPGDDAGVAVGAGGLGARPGRRRRGRRRPVDGARRAVLRQRRFDRRRLSWRHSLATARVAGQRAPICASRLACVD